MDRELLDRDRWIVNRNTNPNPTNTNKYNKNIISTSVSS